jgi:hypothetical protein
MHRKSRRKELEEQWERERRKRGRARVSIVEIPADMVDMARLRRGKRPKRLRAADLVQELARLALEWADRRFAECARALFELGIVDEKGRFTKKRGPHVYLNDKPLDDAQVAVRVRTLKKDNPAMSDREACRQIVKDFGWAATRTTRFEAAFEDVRNP